MSITVQQHDSHLKVAILGQIQTSGECAELRNILTANESTVAVFELNFYDADALPADMIELLSRLLSQGVSIKIVTYHMRLARSLRRLGLPVRQVSNAPQRVLRSRCRALVLAGSAASLDKIILIIKSLPLSDVAVFVAQHVPEDQPNLLDQLLKTRTDYAVVMPQNMMPVQPGTLYVAPPGYHMKVAHGLVYLTRDPRVQFARPSIDLLFKSLAEEYGDAVLATLLCGFGRDGVDGCGALKAAGSMVLVENGAECGDARIMPDAARDAEQYDFILTAAAMASIAAATVAGENAKPSGILLDLFINALASQYGYDFHGYQRDSLERRIMNLSPQFGVKHFAEFQCSVLSNEAIFERLCTELSVGVTSFFRHPEQFQYLRSEIFPYLASFPMIKLWSAGCSTGEEAYSLAIVLDELGLLDRSHLFASDINHDALALAKAGLYPNEHQRISVENYLASEGAGSFESYVVPGEYFLKVGERICQKPVFHQHSLTHEGVFNEFQLIICRNVMIYFNVELQRQILQRFAKSLHVDGFLMLGPQDGLKFVAADEGFVPVKLGSHIYQYKGERLHA